MMATTTFASPSSSEAVVSLDKSRSKLDNWQGLELEYEVWRDGREAYPGLLLRVWISRL